MPAGEHLGFEHTSECWKRMYRLENICFLCSLSSGFSALARAQKEKPLIYKDFLSVHNKAQTCDSIVVTDLLYESASHEAFL